MDKVPMEELSDKLRREYEPMLGTFEAVFSSERPKDDILLAAGAKEDFEREVLGRYFDEKVAYENVMSSERWFLKSGFSKEGREKRREVREKRRDAKIKVKSYKNSVVIDLVAGYLRNNQDLWFHPQVEPKEREAYLEAQKNRI